MRLLFSIYGNRTCQFIDPFRRRHAPLGGTGFTPIEFARQRSLVPPLPPPSFSTPFPALREGPPLTRYTLPGLQGSEELPC